MNARAHDESNASHTKVCRLISHHNGADYTGQREVFRKQGSPAGWYRIVNPTGLSWMMVPRCYGVGEYSCVGLRSERPKDPFETAEV